MSRVLATTSALGRSASGQIRGEKMVPTREHVVAVHDDTSKESSMGCKYPKASKRASRQVIS